MNRADGVRVACPLFQAEGSGSIPTSALQLRFRPVPVAMAIDMNRLWHSRLPILRKGNLVGGLFYAAEFEGLYYATAVWTHPVARLLPQQTWLELRRFAIAPDAPRNTASRMLGWMARDVKVRRPAIVRLVSYQDTEVHTGMIYRAAGWDAVAMTDAIYGNHHQWSNKGRSRAKGQSDAVKQRWEKAI